MRNPQIFYFSASLSRLKCNEISEEIPCQERKNTPNIPVGRRFCALEVTDPGASGRGGREALCGGHGLSSFEQSFGDQTLKKCWHLGFSKQDDPPIHLSLLLKTYLNSSSKTMATFPHLPSSMRAYASETCSSGKR